MMIATFSPLEIGKMADAKHPEIYRGSDVTVLKEFY
jgi:hypothetical protein